MTRLDIVAFPFDRSMEVEFGVHRVAGMRLSSMLLGELEQSAVVVGLKVFTAPTFQCSSAHSPDG